MAFKPDLNRLWPGLALLIGIGLLTLFWFWEPLLSKLAVVYRLITEREGITAYVASFGGAAPFVFMGIQVLQVILAPIPGEATGFIGGYLFGAFKGCMYSTVALSIGSWLNFCIGRFLGKRWVRRVIPSDKLKKFDYMFRHHGVLVAFVLFLFPGFPKDYLCLFLGISTMPMRVFLLMASAGRIPGTLMLSLQGALVFEKNYLFFCLIVAVNLVVVLYGYRHRESLYRWIEKINGRPAEEIDGEGD